MTAPWTCCRCGRPIDGDPHTDPATGDDVHEACCAACHPHLAAVYEIELDVDTDKRGRLLIAGHGGGLTQDQAARGDRGAA